MKLPDRLRAYRRRHRLSQAQLAARVGIPQQRIADLESGHRCASRAIAHALAAVTGWNAHQIRREAVLTREARANTAPSG